MWEQWLVFFHSYSWLWVPTFALMALWDLSLPGLGIPVGLTWGSTCMPGNSPLERIKQAPQPKHWHKPPLLVGTKDENPQSFLPAPPSLLLTTTALGGHGLGPAGHFWVGWLRLPAFPLRSNPASPYHMAKQFFALMSVLQGISYL